MSGATTATYLMAGAALAGTAATIDANKQASHQAKLQQQQQADQLAEAGRIAEQERLAAERLQKQQLDAQRRLQAANLAAQQKAHAESLAAAEKQAAESKTLMDKQLKAADENMNRATQKRPNTSSILSEAEQAGKAGVSGTMLTGPSGIDPSELKLGKTTLLGA